MDELSINFGRHRIMGCPFHGLVRGARLTLPNGQRKDNQWFATQVRASFRVAVPGVSAVIRDADEVAADAAAGYQWRPDAVINLWNVDQRLSLYGRLSFNGVALYARYVGNCWAIKLPFSLDANAGKTQLLQPAVFERFGHLTTSMEVDERSVVVALAGYDPANDQDAPHPTPVTWDSLPDGHQVIMGGAAWDSMHELHQPAPRFDLLRVAGAGTPESPFAATIEKLSDSESGVSAWADNFETWSGVIDWKAAITQEYIAPLDDRSGACPWFKSTTTGSTLTLDPDGISSNETPYLSVTTGTRNASLTDHVIGWWFVDGVAQPVTLDIEYTLAEAHELSGGATAITPKVEVTRYSLINGGCAPSPYPGDEIYNEDGLFQFSGVITRSTTERLVRRLKVGGTLIDTADILYERTSTKTLSGTGTVFESGSIDGGTTTFVITHRLTADGEQIDVNTQTFINPNIDFGVDDFYSIIRAVDKGNLFASADPVTYWLPLLSGASFPADIAQVKWQCRAHWWSNHLVCLLRRLSPYAGSTGNNYTYGPTAYPGGVSGGQISVPAPSPSSNPVPRYGARNPLTGEVLLGQTEKVTFI